MLQTYQSREKNIQNIFNFAFRKKRHTHIHFRFKVSQAKYYTYLDFYLNRVGSRIGRLSLKKIVNDAPSSCIYYVIICQKFNSNSNIQCMRVTYVFRITSQITVMIKVSHREL